MGWGTTFNTEIYLNRMIFQQKWEIEEKIQQNEKYISDSITKLKMFVSANPKDIIDIEWKEEPINWLSNQVDDLIEFIEDTSYENYKLNLYLDYINEKCNGEIPKNTFNNE